MYGIFTYIYHENRQMYVKWASGIFYSENEYTQEDQHGTWEKSLWKRN